MAGMPIVRNPMVWTRQLWESRFLDKAIVRGDIAALLAPASFCFKFTLTVYPECAVPPAG